jgi:hypothetical protein
MIILCNSTTEKGEFRIFTQSHYLIISKNDNSSKTCLLFLLRPHLFDFNISAMHFDTEKFSCTTHLAS